MDRDSTEHEQIVFRRDRATGFRAIIAIHDTRLGPAAGGCRLWHYATEAEALADALRLSGGMTFKNALADIPFGGGKTVILGEPGRRPTEAELETLGDWIEALGGHYVTAEDVGMRVADMRVIARKTRYVSGLGRDGIGGDPSPATAEGVHLGIQAAVRHRLGVESLAGVRVAVQGLGNVGLELCRRLSAAGAALVVADLEPAAVDRAVRELGARAVPVAEILAQEVDVFSPCALGGVLSQETLPLLRASVVAGSANNQLADPEVAEALAAAGVLYAPDYVINAGGVISVAAEYLASSGEDPGPDWVRARIGDIPARLERIFRTAETEGRPTEAVARSLAESVLARHEGVSDPASASRAAR